MVEWLVEFLKTQGTAAAVIIVSVWFMIRELRMDQKRTGDDVSAIRGRMDCFEKSQHACQLDIAREYATKVDLEKESERINSHETRISKLEGRS